MSKLYKEKVKMMPTLVMPFSQFLVNGTYDQTSIDVSSPIDQKKEKKSSLEFSV